MLRPGIYLAHKPVGDTSFSVVRTFMAELQAARPGKRTPVCHGGTLDPFAEGLLLLLVGQATRLMDLIHPVPKRYVAGVQGRPSEAALARLREGLVLEDGPTRPALARLREDGRVELTLTEGRHHQVKRMLATVGHPVQTLHREAVGEVVLDVPEGAWRLLSPEECARGLQLERP